MAQSTTNLGKIHVFPSETLYNQFKNLVADNDLALLKDDGAYIVAANLAQNGYVKFSNGLIMQWGYATGSWGSSGTTVTFALAFPVECKIAFNITNATDTKTTGANSVEWVSATQAKFHFPTTTSTKVWWFALGN